MDFRILFRINLLKKQEFFKEEIASGEIKEIKVTEELFNDNIYIVHKKSKNSKNISRFINILKKQYKEEL